MSDELNKSLIESGRKGLNWGLGTSLAGYAANLVNTIVNKPERQIAEKPALTAPVFKAPTVSANTSIFDQARRDIHGQAAGAVRTARETGNTFVAPALLAEETKGLSDLAGKESAYLTEVDNVNAAAEAEAFNKRSEAVSNAENQAEAMRYQTQLAYDQQYDAEKMYKQQSIMEQIMQIGNTFTNYNQGKFNLGMVNAMFEQLKSGDTEDTGYTGITPEQILAENQERLKSEKQLADKKKQAREDAMNEDFDMPERNVDDSILSKISPLRRKKTERVTVDKDVNTVSPRTGSRLVNVPEKEIVDWNKSLGRDKAFTRTDVEIFQDKPKDWELTKREDMGISTLTPNSTVFKFKVDENNIKGIRSGAKVAPINYLDKPEGIIDENELIERLKYL